MCIRDRVWCPGSTFKPVVAGIGLKTESIDPKEDFGNEGLAWQKDSSWGSYQAVSYTHLYRLRRIGNKETGRCRSERNRTAQAKTGGV